MMLSGLTKQIDSLLFGSFFDLHRASKLLQAKIQECKETQFELDPRLELSEEKHNSELSASIERIERIEDKASKSLPGITLAIAVLGATSKIDGTLACYPMSVRIVAAVLLMLAMAYLLGSGWLALQAYKTGLIYRPSLNDLVHDKSKQAMKILYCIEQNYRVGTMRSNQLVASFNCIRNGIMAIFLLGVLLVFSDLLFSR